MKLKLLLTISLSTYSYFGLGQFTFQKVYENRNDGCSSIQSTVDGGFVIAATKRRYASGPYDMELIKINSTGNLIWAKTFGGTGLTAGSFAEQTNDSGYIIGGYSQPGAAGNIMYIVKTDSSGTLQWSKTYGSAILRNYRAYQVKQTNDGGYIICGYAEPIANGPHAACLIKINSIGDTIWTQAYKGFPESHGYCVEQTSDGGYVLAGDITDTLTTFVTNALIVKTDSNGDTLWTKSIGGTFNNCCLSANSIKPTIDGGYILTGTTSYGAGNGDVFLTKTDANGNPVWTQTFGGIQTDRGITVVETQDSGYVIAGYTFSFGNFNGEYYLIKTNINGDTLWTRRFGSTSWNYASHVIQTSDGGYILSGTSGGFGSFGMYVVKTDANGNTGCYENSTQTIVTSPLLQVTNLQINLFRGMFVSIPTTVSGNAGLDSTICSTVGINENNQIKISISISPNPFNNEIKIHGAEKGEVVLFNVAGKEILRKKTFEGETKLDVENISSGFYLLHYSDKKRIENLKVIKQ